jgi:hypothetical protein
MAKFNSLKLTNDGLDLQSKAQAGTLLEFSRVAVGDGELPDGTDLIDLTSLINEKESLDITSISVDEDGNAKVRSTISNQGLDNGFYIREIGLFANDPDKGEILYCIANAGDLADYLPSGYGTDIVESTLDLITVVGNADNVAAEINKSLTYASIKDLEDSYQDLNGGVTVRIADILTEGVLDGGDITENTTPDLNIIVNKLIGYNSNGSRINLVSNQTLDLSTYLPTTTGNEKYVSIYIDAIDLETNTEINIVEGTSAIAGSAKRPDIDNSQGVLLADVSLSEGQTSIVNSDIEEFRKQKIYFEGKTQQKENISALTNPKRMNRRADFSSSFINFTKYKKNPILSGDIETQNQAGFVSVIHAEDVLSSPIDKFYMFWAGHDGGGIRLATAPHPLGPWTRYGKLFDVTDAGGGNHVSSPEVFYHPESNQLVMLYHRSHIVTKNGITTTIQDTEKAYHSTLTDGITWSGFEPVAEASLDGHWDDKTKAYMRTMRIQDYYIGVCQSRDQNANTKGVNLLISAKDNINYGIASLIPLFYNTQYVDEYDPSGDIGGAPNLFLYEGGLWLLYGDGNTNRIIKAAPLNEPYLKHPPVTDVLSPTETWEGSMLEAPCPFVWDGVIYLYYNSITDNFSKREVGVAYYDWREEQ